jgi:predicted short-subunit dehydrogenase-like oxidoreductase (DUF2520 family)
MLRMSMGIVGAGKVGSVLASQLRAAGYPIVGVSGRSAASRLRISTLLPGVAVLDPVGVAAASDILVLAVPDDALIAVAEELAASGAVRPGQYVLHTSGRHGLDALAALTRLGARPIAFHPAMTFTGTTVDMGGGPVFGLTAAAADRPLAEELVEALGGVPMWVAETDRALYHAALVHGANHLVTLVAQSMDLLRGVMKEGAGAPDPAAVLRPLLTAALDNVLAYGDSALTGPIVRGDVTTIRAHVDALAAADVDPATVDAYLELARATAGRAEADHRLDAVSAGTIRQVLDEADWDAMADIAAGL